MTRRVVWRCFHVAVGANLWSGSLTREELLPVAAQTGCVFGKLSDVRKRGILLAHLLPVFARDTVTSIAREFLFRDVCGVRKSCEIDARLGASLALRDRDAT